MSLSSDSEILEDCYVSVYTHTIRSDGPLQPTGSPPSDDEPAAGGSGYEMLTAYQTTSSSRGRRTLKARRSLPARHSPSLLNDSVPQFLADSGSDDDSNDSIDAEFSRMDSRRLRQEMIEREEGNVIEGDEREELGVLEDDPLHREFVEEDDGSAWHVPIMLDRVKYEIDELESNISTDFQWSGDFSTFTGQREAYRRDPGPTISCQEPVEIFLKFWDEDVMGLIAAATNKYARDHIEPNTDPDSGAGIPKYMEQWDDITIPILYKYFALLIYMSFCQRSQVQEYWKKDMMGMPMFRKAMNRDVFLLITKFLRFVNDRETPAGGYAGKIGKVAPIIDHCNRKFSELYIPAQHISLDESLLLWKGRLSWRQCIRSKAARFGIKSFELCEATTGYLLKYKLYTGKGTPMHPEPLHGFTKTSTKVVLELMEEYLDVGHVLVMDNWYNQLLLTRYLKSRGTDVLGTINRTRKNIPQDLKDLVPNRVERGEWHARHCGDIALVAWKDVKLVTVMSTYHEHQMVPGTRAGVTREKPVSINDYNKYMGGVDLKDQKLSMFLFERKRNKKWYIKIFRRLLNTSLLNAFIIYTRNPMHRLCSHRDFRRKVAEGLLARFGEVPVPPLPAALSDKALRLQPGRHFPVHTEKLPYKAEHRKLSCARCKILKKRSQVRLMCSLCRVPLCVGKCWLEYHTRVNLSTTGYAIDD